MGSPIMEQKHELPQARKNNGIRTSIFVAKIEDVQ
jgi:hypothetical protein